MSRGQWIVVAIAVGAVALLLLYEGWALWHQSRGGTEYRTISRYVWEASAKYHLIPWAVGLVMGLLAGHFWWPRTP